MKESRILHRLRFEDELLYKDSDNSNENEITNDDDDDDDENDENDARMRPPSSPPPPRPGNTINDNNDNNNNNNNNKSSGEDVLKGISSHSHAEDTRNDSILVGIRTTMPSVPPHNNNNSNNNNTSNNSFMIVPKVKALVNVFDSGFMLGDGVWEGIRVHNGVLIKGRKHLKR